METTTALDATKELANSQEIYDLWDEDKLKHSWDGNKIADLNDDVIFTPPEDAPPNARLVAHMEEDSKNYGRIMWYAINEMPRERDDRDAGLEMFSAIRRPRRRQRYQIYKNMVTPKISKADREFRKRGDDHIKESYNLDTIIRVSPEIPPRDAPEHVKLYYASDDIWGQDQGRYYWCFRNKFGVSYFRWCDTRAIHMYTPF